MLTDKPVFKFQSMAYAGDTFAVVSFKGQEGLSQLFEYEILLSSENHDLDFEDILENPASFSIMTGKNPVQTSGIVRRFQMLRQVGPYAIYRASLVPKLWWLTLTRHNQIFLDKTIPEIIQEVLKQGGLTDQDYSLELQNDYPKREFVCQYDETLFDFVSRWMEYEGIYYYYEYQEHKEVLVITDTLMAHKDLPQQKSLLYSPVSGLDSVQREQIVFAFVAEQNIVPSAVQVKDFNYETPSLKIMEKHSVKEAGKGTNYLYGNHLRTPSECQAFARVRSQEHQAQSALFHGESTVPFLHPGYICTLSSHFRKAYNQDYLLVQCRHKGNQTAYLVAGLQEVHQEADGQVTYENSFTAIPASTQYRPPMTTPKPRIAGTVNAFVDASESGEYAEVDDQGRYKIILPFDLSGRKDGHASYWVRMAQPYAGADHGMHFPLHKGCEVLVTFIEGDPDKPIIAAAVPNPEHPSQIVSADQTMCKITTSGQNKLHIEDKKDSQRMLMSTPHQNSWLRMGAPNDPPASAVTMGDDEEESDGLHTKHDSGGFAINTEGSWNSNIHQSMGIKVGGNSTEIVVGGEEIFIGGFDNKTVGGVKTDITVGGVISFALAGVLDITITKKLEITKGTIWELNTAEHIELGEEKDKIHESHNEVEEEHTEVHEVSTQVSEENTEIRELKTTLAETKEKLTEMETALAATKESIAESETKLRQDINRVLSEELGVIESAIDMIASNVTIGEDDMRTFITSTEVTEKTFL